MSPRCTVLALMLLALVGCGRLPVKQLDEAERLAGQARPEMVECARDDACAIDSALYALGEQALAEATAEAPVHRVLLLEGGEDALLARIHLIRSARRSIELQSFIFAEDDAGFFVLGELLDAARRGVRVRVLLDQLFSVDDTRLLAALATAHANFELRMYNPTFGKASTGPLEFGAGILCCFRRFNQRMHTKLLLVDGLIGITGGRNYQNRYFDWDSGYNYRDRDILVAGPVGAKMRAGFELFWTHERSVPVARLNDVAAHLLAHGGPPPLLPAPRLTRAGRILRISQAASDPEVVQARLIAPSLAVGRVDYYVDPPQKHERGRDPLYEEISHRLQSLVAGAERSVVLQTPYLVLSREARQTFRALRRRENAPEVLVSTNSLAATDAWPVYALSHKYKRSYLRDLGFDIREYKPFPADAPIDLAATGALDAEVAPSGVPLTDAPTAFGSGARGGSGATGSGSGSMRDGPLPLRRAGVRVGLHAKSIVIDGRVGIVGTHNFDPRSDHYNTENAVIVHDAAFAAALERVIRHDARPENAWLIARRPKPPVLSGLDYSIGKAFEKLPLFDLWPLRYATSYELVEGCPPVRPEHPRFAECWTPAGDFPEVDLRLKGFYTRLVTAFGAGLAPIL